MRSVLTHLELAGEGIEYSWGASKRVYRKQPIMKKKSVKNFESLVTSSLNSVTIKMARKFSAKARGYMLAYSHKKMQDEGCNDDTVKYEWNFEHNERIQKMYRLHRDVSVFDGRFIEKVLKESIKVESV